MANVKISELVQATDISDDDLLIIETENGTRSVPYGKIRESSLNENVVDKIDSISNDLSTVKNNLGYELLASYTGSVSAGGSRSKWEFTLTGTGGYIYVPETIYLSTLEVDGRPTIKLESSAPGGVVLRPHETIIAPLYIPFKSGITIMDDFQKPGSTNDEYISTFYVYGNRTATIDVSNSGSNSSMVCNFNALNIVEE